METTEKKMTEEVQEAIRQYVFLWPVPYALSENLRIMSELSAALHRKDRLFKIACGMAHGTQQNYTNLVRVSDIEESDTRL